MMSFTVSYSSVFSLLSSFLLTFTSFSADVKPIVSLDESPSDSNMDDNNSSYSNSFVAPILENSLAGISPGSQLPNSSSMFLNQK